jgi:hypothetical protein
MISSDAADAGGPALKDPAAGGEPERNDHPPSKADQARYWSAFAYMDEFAILKHWEEHQSDYAFVTAHVKLPTRDGVLTREFPLYTIKGTSIQSHQGVDLLQKFPLSGAAREQVTISLDVRYLKNAAALDVTRTIVSNAEKLAEPYLRNFPVASSIMSSAVSLTDALAAKQAEGINTAAFSINPQRLRGLHPYLLVTEDFAGLPLGLVACADKPSALCWPPGSAGKCAQSPPRLTPTVTSKGKTGVSTPPPPTDASHSLQPKYEECAYHDTVYVTLRFEDREDVYDPLMLLRGAGACPLIDQGTLDIAREYLRSNMSLFVDHDVAIAEAAFAYAEQYLKLRNGATQKNFGGMLDILNEYRDDDLTVRKLMHIGKDDDLLLINSQPEQMLVNALGCYRSFWEQTPGQEVLAAWKVVSATGASKASDSTVNRLNSLGYVLSRLGAFSGASDWQADGKNTGAVIELLRGEAKGLILSQERAVDDALRERPSCDSDGRKKLLELFSTECRPCVDALTDYCVNNPVVAKRISSGDLERDISAKRAVDQTTGMQQVQNLTAAQPPSTPQK